MKRTENRSNTQNPEEKKETKISIWVFRCDDVTITSHLKNLERKSERKNVFLFNILIITQQHRCRLRIDACCTLYKSNDCYKHRSRIQCLSEYIYVSRWNNCYLLMLKLLLLLPPLIRKQQKSRTALHLDVDVCVLMSICVSGVSEPRRIRYCALKSF